MDERLDLRALELDDGRRELLVAAILARAGPELRRRAQEELSPMLVLSRWARPALAAAAVLALVSLPVLLREVNEQAPGAGLSDALSIPSPADAWLADEREPTIGDVLIAMESEDR